MNFKLDISVCRVCLKSEIGTSIFEDTELLDKFQYCTQLKVKKNDGLPVLLCSRCIARLRVAYDFRKQSVISENHLRAFMSRVANQFKEVATNMTEATGKDLVLTSDDEVQLLFEAGYNNDQGMVQDDRGTIIKTKIEREDEQDQNDDLVDEHHLDQDHENDHDQEQDPEQDEEHSREQDHIDEDLLAIIQEDGGDDNDDVIENDMHQESHDDDVCDNDMDIYEGSAIDVEGNCNNEHDLVQDQDPDSDSRHTQVVITLNMNGAFVNRHDEVVDLVDDEGDTMNSDLQRDDINMNNDENSQDMSITPSEQFIISNMRTLRSTTEKPKNENRSNICIKCDKDFSTKTNLMRHMMTHEGIKRYQCNVCGNGFTQNGSLKQHMLIHTGERPHKCDVCNRGFTQAKSLVFHMRRHTGEKPFACDKCGLTFRQKDGLKRHVSMKHECTPNSINTHVCSICQRVLRSKYSLNLHMKKHIDPNENIHKCEICEKNFSSKSSLENHHRQHTGEKPFKCDTCGRSFSRKGSLLSHEKVHLEVKPFVCELCGKGFVQKHQIIAHMDTHQNQPTKTFQCGKCYKSFSIKRNLLQHLRNHNRDSMTIYKCEDCDVAFSTKRSLKLHRLNEHKESVSDLNECDICHIPFVAVADLNQHMISVHDNIDEKCELCDQNFTSKKLLDDHLLEHELLTIN